MKEVLETFEDLIRRIFGPATALFPLLIAAHWLECVIVNTDACSTRHANLVDWLFSLQGSDPRTILAGLLLLFGAGYVMAMLHCFLFDHWLHKSFQSSALWAFASQKLEKLASRFPINSNSAPIDLAALRTKAITKLNSLESVSPKGWLSSDAGDYLLYEIIGGIDKGSTKQVVDSAKAYGIVCISGMIATISLVPCVSLSLWSAFVFLVALYLWWFLGFMLVKAQYRWRSVRHYVNILMWPNQKIDKILADYKEESCKDEKAKAEAGKS